MTDGKYQTVNHNCSYEIIIPNVKVEDGGEYRVEGGGYESTVSLTVKGWHFDIWNYISLVNIILTNKYTQWRTARRLCMFVEKPRNKKLL